jgi:repressor LexA
MSNQALTRRQQQILGFIAEYLDSEGFPPTRSELSAHFGFRSPNAAESHLRALARKGVIQLERGRSRGIALTSLAVGALPPSVRLRVPLPLVGHVAAGSPILAQQNIENEYRVDPALFTPRPHYLLRVEGMSMRDAGILDQDLLAVHRTPEARNGQIVVARVDDEVTVKHFQRREHQVSLLPANPDFKPIDIDLRRQELVIEGLGVGVIRNQMDT